MVEQIVDAGSTGVTANSADYIEVVFARFSEEARQYCELLQENGIAARLEADGDLPSTCGVAVLIPPERLLDGSEVLSFQAQYDSEEEEGEGDDDEDYDDYEDDDDDDDDFDDDDDDEDLEDEEDLYETIVDE